jgi:hypothetical protein
LLSEDEAIFCYHGNYMHIASLIPHLQKVTRPFRLRVIVAARVAPNVTEQLTKAGINHEPIRAHEVDRIHMDVRSCDIGLVPQQVYPLLDGEKLASSTSSAFLQVDGHHLDIVMRCKVTQNIGRASVFLQVGVPTISDVCPETFALAQFRGKQLIQLVHYNRAWPHIIDKVSSDFALRLLLSANSFTYASEFLTNERQAQRYIKQIGEYKRMNDG